MTEEERLEANKLLEERRAVHDKDVAEITQTKESVAAKKPNVARQEKIIKELENEIDLIDMYLDHENKSNSRYPSYEEVNKEYKPTKANSSSNIIRSHRTGNTRSTSELLLIRKLLSQKLNAVKEDRSSYDEYILNLYLNS